MSYLEFVLRGLGILGSAYFSAMSLSISTLIMPIIFRHKGVTTKQRIEFWSDLTYLVDQRWLPCGLLSSVAFATAAYMTQNERTVLIASAISMFSIVPLTLTLVVPYVEKLNGLLKSDDEIVKREGDATLKSWGVVHWSRTIGPLAAAILGLMDLIRLIPFE